MNESTDFVSKVVKTVFKIVVVIFKLLPLLLLAAFFSAVLNGEFVVAFAWLSILGIWYLAAKAIDFLKKERDGTQSVFSMAS